jgi:hypothetical protein
MEVSGQLHALIIIIIIIIIITIPPTDRSRSLFPFQCNDSAFYKYLFLAGDDLTSMSTIFHLVLWLDVLYSSTYKTLFYVLS